MDAINKPLVPSVEPLLVAAVDAACSSPSAAPSCVKENRSVTQDNKNKIREHWRLTFSCAASALEGLIVAFSLLFLVVLPD